MTSWRTRQQEDNISKTERCNRELQDKEAENKTRAKLSKYYNCSKEKVHQLEGRVHETNTKIASYEMSVVQLEDKKRELTEQMKSFVTKHEELLQQLRNIAKTRRHKCNGLVCCSKGANWRTFVDE